MTTPDGYGVSKGSAGGLQGRSFAFDRSHSATWDQTSEGLCCESQELDSRIRRINPP